MNHPYRDNFHMQMFKITYHWRGIYGGPNGLSINKGQDMADAVKEFFEQHGVDKVYIIEVLPIEYR